MALKRIRLELARDHDFQDGSRERGYDLIAPIDDNDHLIAEQWRKEREKCRVRRFWAGEEEMGHLVHKRGGTWPFDYDPKPRRTTSLAFALTSTDSRRASASH